MVDGLDSRDGVCESEVEVCVIGKLMYVGVKACRHVIDIDEKEERTEDRSLRNSSVDVFEGGANTCYNHSLASITEVAFKPFVQGTRDTILFKFE